MPPRSAEAFPFAAEVDGLLLGCFDLSCGFGLGCVSRGELAAEAVDAAGSVYELLLAGEERVASGADFDDDVAFVSGAGFEGVPAGALHGDFVVGGMNSSLRHFLILSSSPAAERFACRGRLRKTHSEGLGRHRRPVALRAWAPTPGALGAFISLPSSPAGTCPLPPTFCAKYSKHSS